MKDANGGDLMVMSSRFKQKEERTKTSKKINKKEEQMKAEVAQHQKKVELEEVIYKDTRYWLIGFRS